MMARQTTHPQKRNRQEKALLQRKDELQAWKSGEANTDHVSSWISDQDEVAQKERKIKVCKEDISALEKKLFI